MELTNPRCLEFVVCPVFRLSDSPLRVSFFFSGVKFLVEEENEGRGRCLPENDDEEEF